MELEGKDKTERFIIAAKERAKAAMNQEYQKLTSLEKGMLEALKNGRVRHVPSIPRERTQPPNFFSLHDRYE